MELNCPVLLHVAYIFIVLACSCGQNSAVEVDDVTANKSSAGRTANSSTKAVRKVCFEYNYKVFAFYLTQMDFKSGRKYCDGHHDESVSIPKKDINAVFKAYKNWNKGPDTSTQFWTQMDFCEWWKSAIQPISDTVESLRRQNAEEEGRVKSIDGLNLNELIKFVTTCPGIYFDIGGEDLLTLKVASSGALLAPFCKLRGKQDCSKDTYIHVFDSGNRFLEIKSDYSEKVMSDAVCPKGETCHKRFCFTYGGLYFEYHSHKKTWRAASETCRKTPGFELYKISDKEEIRQVKLKLQSYNIFPLFFWIDNFVCDLECNTSSCENLIYGYSLIRKCEEFFSFYRQRVDCNLAVCGTSKLESLLQTERSNMELPFLCTKRLQPHSCPPTDETNSESSISEIPQTIHETDQTLQNSTDPYNEFSSYSTLITERQETISSTEFTVSDYPANSSTALRETTEEYANSNSEFTTEQENTKITTTEFQDTDITRKTSRNVETISDASNTTPFNPAANSTIPSGTIQENRANTDIDNERITEGEESESTAAEVEATGISTRTTTNTEIILDANNTTPFNPAANSTIPRGKTQENPDTDTENERTTESEVSKTTTEEVDATGISTRTTTNTEITSDANNTTPFDPAANSTIIPSGRTQENPDTDTENERTTESEVSKSTTSEIDATGISTRTTTNTETTSDANNTTPFDPAVNSTIPSGRTKENPDTGTENELSTESEVSKSTTPEVDATGISTRTTTNTETTSDANNTTPFNPAANSTIIPSGRTQENPDTDTENERTTESEVSKSTTSEVDATGISTRTTANTETTSDANNTSPFNPAANSTIPSGRTQENPDTVTENGRTTESEVSKNTTAEVDTTGISTRTTTNTEISSDANNTTPFNPAANSTIASGRTQENPDTDIEKESTTEGGESKGRTSEATGISITTTINKKSTSGTANTTPFNPEASSTISGKTTHDNPNKKTVTELYKHSTAVTESEEVRSDDEIVISNPPSTEIHDHDETISLPTRNALTELENITCEKKTTAHVATEVITEKEILNTSRTGNVITDASDFSGKEIFSDDPTMETITEISNGWEITTSINSSSEISTYKEATISGYSVEENGDEVKRTSPVIFPTEYTEETSHYVQSTTNPPDTIQEENRIEEKVTFQAGSRTYIFYPKPQEWESAMDICQKNCQQMFTPDSIVETKFLIKKLLEVIKGKALKFWTGNSLCLASASPKYYAEEGSILKCLNNFTGKHYCNIIIGGECRKIAISVNNFINFIKVLPRSRLPFVCSADSSSTCNYHSTNDRSEDGTSAVYILYSFNPALRNKVLSAEDRFFEFVKHKCYAADPRSLLKDLPKYKPSRISVPSRAPPAAKVMPRKSGFRLMKIDLRLISKGANSKEKYTFVLKEHDWKSAKKKCEEFDSEMFSPTSVEEIEYYAKMLDELDTDGNHWFWSRMIACNSSKKIVPDKKIMETAEIFREKFFPNISLEVLDEECGNVAINISDHIVFSVEAPTKEFKFICTTKNYFFMPSENDSFITSQATTKTPVTTVRASVTERTTHGTTQTPFCKRIHKHGIHWPRTELGREAYANCPKGKFGKIVWECDADSGQFIGEPKVDCKPIDCSKAPPEEMEMCDEQSYLVESLLACKDKNMKPDTEMKELMDAIRRHRKTLVNDNYDAFGSSIDEPRSGIEYVNSALGVFDRLMEKDVKLWDQMDKKERMSTSMDIIKEAEETGWMMACQKTASFVMKQNLGMRVVPLKETTEVEFDLDGDKRDFAKFPNGATPLTSKCTQVTSVAVAASFKNIQKFLSPVDGKYNVTSNIMGLSFGEKDTYSFPPGKQMQMRLHHPPKPAGAVAKCVFLNWKENSTNQYGVWDTYGCEIVATEETYTECRCSHLTNFAILMDFTGNEFSERDERILSLVSLVFSTLSSITLLLTIIIYTSIRSLRNRRNNITCNLAACLLIMNILVQSGLERVSTEVCFVISILLQYSVLSSFIWMLLEGIILYKLVILVFETTRIRLPVLYAVAYGIPIVIIAISSCVRPEQMIREKYCWPSADKGMVWSVVGPIVLVITVNIIIFGMTMNAAVRIDKMSITNKSVRDRKKGLMKRLKGMVSLTCVLGFTWIVGFFYVPQKPTVSAYLFVTLNGLQGVLLFVTQMLLNNYVRHKLFVIYKENIAKLTSATTTWNYFFNTAKQPEAKILVEENSIVFSDVRPTNFYVVNTNIYPTAPPSESEKSSQKISFEDDLHTRHPFEINYET